MKLKRKLDRKDKALTESAALLVLSKCSTLMGLRGSMGSLAKRSEILELLDEVISSRARQEDAREVIGGIAAGTLRTMAPRWRGFTTHLPSNGGPTDTAWAYQRGRMPAHRGRLRPA